MESAAVASAVTVPETTPELPSPTNGLKRRQSNVSEQEQENESKRQRISPGKNSPAAARDDANRTQQPIDGGSHDSREARRKSNVADEKQRSKRLFGALLGSLSQPGDRTSKRRQEIESRRKAELQRQDEERVEDNQRRQEQLAEQRKKAQVNVDEEIMRIRHSNMLNTASFLQTVSEPRLYYRPWDLRPDEEDRIDDQIKETQSQIDEELGKLDKQVEGESQSESHPDPNVSTTNNEIEDAARTIEMSQSIVTAKTNGEADQPAETEDQASAKSAFNAESKPAEVPDSEPTDPDPDTNKDLEPTKDEATEEDRKTGEEDGDHVVEGDEDTVIY